jgi:hypothetical protein
MRIVALITHFIAMNSISIYLKGKASSLLNKVGRFTVIKKKNLLSLLTNLDLLILSSISLTSSLI